MAVLPVSPHGSAFSVEQAERLASVDPGHFWFAGRNALILWALDRHFPDAASMLEVGCGTGHVLTAIAAARPELRLTGTDLSPECLRRAASAAPSATLVHADARDPVAHGAFDVVGAFDLLEHVTDERDVLAGMAVAVRPGGGVLLTVPQHPWLWSPTDERAGHLRRYRRRDLLALVRSAGLEVLGATSFVSTLLPLLLASRYAGRHRLVDSRAGFSVSPGANRIGRVAMELDRRLIAAGVSLPAGGSLLVVAKRPA